MKRSSSKLKLILFTLIAHVVLGQSSAAWEFLHDKPELDLIITPVGGGGLSGSILAAEAFHAHKGKPLCKVLATEPEQANDAYRSMQSGSIQSLTISKYRVQRLQTDRTT